MRILILTTSFPAETDRGETFLGGIFVLAEALAYERAGASVTVLTPHMPGATVRETMSEGIEVIRFRYFLPTSWQCVRAPDVPIYGRLSLRRWLQLPLFLIAFVVAIMRLARRADIIHANWTPVALLALPAKYLIGVPVVCSYRGSDINKLPPRLNRFIMRRVNATINLMADTRRGRSVRERFPGCYLDLPFIRREPTDHAAADLSRFEPGLTHFLFVGRLTTTKGAEKGVDLLVPAVSALSRSTAAFRVHVLGDGPERQRMKAQAEAVGCAKYLHFYGFRENVFPYMQCADAVIGGLGLNAVVQEGASCGKLLLLSDLPGFNGSIWEHRHNALLYDPHEPGSLAAVMTAALNEPRLCAEIARRGAATAERYVVDLTRGGKVYLDAFRTVIDSHPEPPG